MRRATVAAAVAATVAAVALAAVVAPGASPSDERAEPTLVEVGDDQLWPYVAPDASFDRPASSMNVVVRDDPAAVRRYLAREGGWNRTDESWANASADDLGALDAEAVPWRDAPGAPRYTYVTGRGWRTERYQLHRGRYFGARDHLRAYGPPDGNWTAVQAHAEHWDWFTVTHTVEGVETAQRRVEAEFLGDARFEVRQVYHANDDTRDADGWTTVVWLAAVPVAVRLRNSGARTALTRVGLAGALAALPLAVRAGGLLFERRLPGLSPDMVVAIWYPVLAVGVPAVAWAVGRRLPATEAGALAGAGFGVGTVLDYAALGVTELPVSVAAHRAVAVAAVALLAAGATDDGLTPPLKAGAALWAAVVVAGHLV